MNDKHNIIVLPSYLSSANEFSSSSFLFCNNAVSRSFTHCRMSMCVCVCVCYGTLFKLYKCFQMEVRSFAGGKTICANYFSDLISINEKHFVFISFCLQYSIICIWFRIAFSITLPNRTTLQFSSLSQFYCSIVLFFAFIYFLSSYLFAYGKRFFFHNDVGFFRENKYSWMASKLYCVHNGTHTHTH